MPERQVSFAMGTVAAVLVLALALRAAVNSPGNVHAGTPQLCCAAEAQIGAKDHRPRIRLRLPMPLLPGRELRVTVEGSNIDMEIKPTGG